MACFGGFWGKTWGAKWLLLKSGVAAPQSPVPLPLIIILFIVYNYNNNKYHSHRVRNNNNRLQSSCYSSISRLHQADFFRHGLSAKSGLEFHLHLVYRFPLFGIDVSSVVLSIWSELRSTAVKFVWRAFFNWITLFWTIITIIRLSNNIENRWIFFVI